MDEHSIMFAPFLNKSGILSDLVTMDGSDYYVFRFDSPTDLHGQRLESFLVPRTDFNRLSAEFVYLILVIVPNAWLIAMGYTGNNLDNGIAAYMELDDRKRV